MLKLIWETKASDRLDEIGDFISQFRPDAADRLIQSVHDALDRTTRFPAIGRPGRISGTRELIVHPNYIVIYRITDTAIQVLNILHARQRYP